MGTAGKPGDCECVRMVRPNILSLPEFQTERSEIESTTGMLLGDLNENGFGPSIAEESWLEAGRDAIIWPEVGPIRDSRQSREVLSRYPDVKQLDLKQAFCDFRNRRNAAALTPSAVSFSAGLDDMIDLIIRCLCRPAHDRVVICPPVYHMYQTTAMINDIGTVSVPLDPQNGFQLRLDELQRTLSSDQNIKICFICTPGNPTGCAISLADIKAVLDNPNWGGILVVDEAYIDFSPSSPSMVGLVSRYPRLVVLQTLSKAFGLASIRVGFAVACPHLCAVLNKARKPYAVSGLSVALAKAALTVPSLAVLDAKLQSVFYERSRLARELGRIRGVVVKGGLDANFVLFGLLGIRTLGEAENRLCNESARRLAESLRSSADILVRFKGSEYGCEGCIRVSVGNGPENERFVKEVRRLTQRLYSA